MESRRDVLRFFIRALLTGEILATQLGLLELIGESGSEDPHDGCFLGGWKH